MLVNLCMSLCLVTLHDLLLHAHVDVIPKYFQDMSQTNLLEWQHPTIKFGELFHVMQSACLLVLNFIHLDSKFNKCGSIFLPILRISENVKQFLKFICSLAQTSPICIKMLWPKV